ncbi:uncharacterized protein AMSG_07988 [Thecamonas trahens ATCC 50062]|uniref:PH domain-containing protein n=1 Tax=Thecamonas trahens ATCC 50062 TaxID=461836 RepID=A0A0L0DHP1_THETB|nr:hypothetical protein AMSG_07988 [Thecamonas trahens ATCC 50062]KNC51889.1 hypothetical protein AMSG_07988 [Thecamonas trahens ATCC 50062]|eukprot:XP_013755746.1 hypothetical protein AMSG_07988 [Thecamonas trahens ATCC 50062]
MSAHSDDQDSELGFDPAAGTSSDTLGDDELFSPTKKATTTVDVTAPPPNDHVAYVHKRLADARGGHAALEKFEESRARMTVAQADREEKHRSRLIQRLGGAVATSQALVELLQKHAAGASAMADMLKETAAAAARIEDLGSIGAALAALGSADLTSLAAYEEYAALLASELIPRAKALAKSTAATANKLGKAIAAATNKLGDARAALDAHYARHAKVTQFRDEASASAKAAKAADPWLTQHEYKQSLRSARKAESAYRHTMGALFVKYSELEVERGAALKTILDDMATARKVLHLKASDALAEPKALARAINGQADVNAFTKKSFTEPPVPDVTKGSRYLKFNSPHILKHGMLSLQRGTVFTSWKPHLFVLSCYGYLHHFPPDKTPSDLATLAPELSLYLPAYTLRPGPHPKAGECAFELRQRESGWFTSAKSTVIKASSVSERIAWEASLHAVMHVHTSSPSSSTA